MWGTLYADVWRVAPILKKKKTGMISGGRLLRAQRNGLPYNNPNHGHPHRAPSTKFISNAKIYHTAAKTAQVVDRDDDAHETVIGVVHVFQEVFVLDDAGEDALVVAWGVLEHIGCSHGP